MEALDPSLKDLVTRRTFKGAFDPDQFIEDITAPLISSIPDDNAAFNPTPFIESLEVVTNSLMHLRSKLEREISDLDIMAEKSFHKHTRHSERLASDISGMAGTFERLETQVAELGGTAIRVGERLETVDRQRAKAVEAGDIMRFWMEFGAGKNVGGGRLEEIRDEEGKEGQFKAAVIARRLAAIAKDVDIPGQEGTRREIEKYCEHFETSLLDEFSGAYEAGDLEHMSMCARVLIEYNGGASVTQHFINKHPFFVEFADLTPDEEESDRRASWRAETPEWETKPPRVDRQLDHLMEEVEKLVKTEWKAVRRVFPNAVSIMQTMVQRIFALTVENYFSQLVERAERHSVQRQLRVLEVSHRRIVQCTHALKKFDQRKIQRSASTNDDVLGDINDPSPAAATAAAAADAGEKEEDKGKGKGTIKDKLRNFIKKGEDEEEGKGGEEEEGRGEEGEGGGEGEGGRVAGVGATLSTALDRCEADLFSRYTDRERYVILERKSLNVAYDQLLGPFNKYMLQRRALYKGSNKLLRTINQLAENARAAAAQSSGSGTSASGTSMDESGGGAVTTPEEDGLLQIDLIVRMLVVHAESVGRCKELSTKAELSRNVREVFRSILLHLHERYVDVVMDATLENIKMSDGKAEPTLGELQAVVTADKVARLLQTHFETAILPWISHSPIILREVLDDKNKALGDIEGKANEILQKILDGLVNYFTTILAKQGKTDFKPKDQEIDLISLATVPCNQSMDFLRKIYTEANKWMSGRNLEVFLTEVGVTFHGMLLEHFRKYTVSPSGALVLSKDISKYQEAIDKWGIRVVSDRFEMLRELGNVFLVKPEILRTLLEEGHLAQIDYKLVKPFLKMREDWSTAKKVLKQKGDPEDDMMGADEESGDAARRREMNNMMRM